MLALLYKKPALPSDKCSSTAIPQELSFERIICNKCAPPCSLQDFLDYLLYEDHSAENLQFFLWMVDYDQRWRKLPGIEQVRSPKWPPPDLLHTSPAQDPIRGQQNCPSELTDVETHSGDVSTASFPESSPVGYSVKNDSSGLPVNPHNPKASWQPSSSRPLQQPLRQELTRIINHYIAPGSPRELRLSHNDRTTVIRALEYTTHPTALSLIKKILDSRLREESHPKFVRWSICNGSRQWTWGLRIFAVMNITLGFLIAIMLIFSHVSRYWRILAALEWWFGITNIIAASQGLCVLLHRMGTRQFHAWETGGIAPDDDEATLKSAKVDYIDYASTTSRWPVKMEVFGPANNFAGESWVTTYSRRPWYRKLFERRAQVQELGLQKIQNRMIRQAELWALLITVPLTVAAVAIPSANLF